VADKVPSSYDSARGAQPLGAFMGSTPTFTSRATRMARVTYAAFGVGSCAAAAFLYASDSLLPAIAAGVVGMALLLWALLSSGTAVASAAQEHLSNHEE
jgi:hypothetical protein